MRSFVLYVYQCYPTLTDRYSVLTFRKILYWTILSKKWTVISIHQCNYCNTQVHIDREYKEKLIIR